MQYEFDFLIFVAVQVTGPKRRFACKNKAHGEILGFVGFYAPWHHYCYFPSGPAVYSDGCLMDIASFIQGLTAEEKGGVSKPKPEPAPAPVATPAPAANAKKGGPAVRKQEPKTPPAPSRKGKAK